LAVISNLGERSIGVGYIEFDWPWRAGGTRS